MTEVALAHIDAEAASAKIKIVGYYHANENFADISVDVFSQKIADKVSKLEIINLIWLLIEYIRHDTLIAALILNFVSSEKSI